MVLLIISLPNVHASITIKENVILKTSSNNAQFLMGADFIFHRVRLNATYLWMDQSYTEGYQTGYCIYVVSPDNCSFTVETWFATINSSGSLTITTPLSTTIYVGFHSPELISAYATGVVSYEWFSGNKTLLMTANTDTDNLIVIYASVTETEEDNIPPENYDVIITDMEGCGNWVFSEESYYSFQAQYWDGDGWADLDICKIAFTDGLTWINASYDVSASEYTLESGEDVVRLKAGTMTIADPNLLQVTFLIYFRNTVRDAYNVSIYMYCRDDGGTVDDWEIKAEDYFNIYNLGGHSTLTSSGDAGRTLGGDIFDLYARNVSNTQGSWVEASIMFRNLQHIKMLPMITWLIENPHWNVSYSFDYCIGDDWIEGFKVKLDCYVTISNGSRWVTFDAYWYNHGEEKKKESIYMYHAQPAAEGENTTTQIWIDLWFNKQNASSTIGGRANAYYFPMVDDSNLWLRWLTGQNWGIDDVRRKQTMCFAALHNIEGNISYTQEISLVEVKCRLEVGAAWDIADTLVILSDYDIFDITIGGEPFVGISTPVFDETKVPVMPQGGFLGTVVSWFQGSIKWLSDNIMFGGLNLWGNFVGFMDTIASWLGFPNGFTNLIAWLGSFVSWLSTSFGWLISMLTSTFNFLTAFMTKLINTTATALGIFTNMINNFFFMIGTGYGYTVGTWEMLGMTWWITIFFILYPLFLLGMWEERGLDAVISHINGVKDILAFIGTIFIRVIELTLNIIGRIIESVPVVE